MTQTVHRLRNGGGGGELPPEMSVRGRTHGSASLEIRNGGKRLWKKFQQHSTQPSYVCYQFSRRDELAEAPTSGATTANNFYSIPPPSSDCHKQP